MADYLQASQNKNGRSNSKNPLIINPTLRNFEFYNARRPHQSLEYRTPDEMYFATVDIKKAA